MRSFFTFFTKFIKRIFINEFWLHISSFILNGLFKFIRKNWWKFPFSNFGSSQYVLMIVFKILWQEAKSSLILLLLSDIYWGKINFNLIIITTIKIRTNLFSSCSICFKDSIFIYFFTIFTIKSLKLKFNVGNLKNTSGITTWVCVNLRLSGNWTAAEIQARHLLKKFITKWYSSLVIRYMGLRSFEDKPRIFKPTLFL